MFQKLIDLRSSKVRELTEWIGKRVTVSWSAAERHEYGLNWMKLECEVVRVTSHFSTFKIITSGKQRSESNVWLDLSWDDVSNRLGVFVDPQRSTM